MGGEIKVSCESGGGLQARITHFSAEEKPAGRREKYSRRLFLYSFTIPLPILSHSPSRPYYSFEISFRVKVFSLLSPLEL
jgi:hypothetical protein